MTTTAEWMTKIKGSADELNHWLTRQYIGECIAARRIADLVDKTPEKFQSTVERIAIDEQNHAQWVGRLLVARGIPLPEVTDLGVRYWQPINDKMVDFEHTAAAGHHAESMRLVRIEALSQDQEIAADIRSTFCSILSDERFHAKAFAAMSTPEAIAEMAPHHQAGLTMLGLEI